MLRYPRLVLIAVVALLPLVSVGHSPEEAGREMAAAAQSWLDSLTADQRKNATFDFPDKERLNWHYIPKSREGLSLANMDDGQRKLARNLLASGLSEHGLLQAEAVIALENVLRIIEDSAHRDDALYFFTIFGQPGAVSSWGWRVEGHHLSINFTVVDGRKISATPNFVGANPAEVRRSGPQAGRRALAPEEDLGRALVLSLDSAQKNRAIISDKAPGDILTRADPQAKPPENAGLSYAAMNPDQQTRFKTLVETYANRLRHELTEAELKKINDTGWNRLGFVWAGGLQPGQGHYYRIQSPDFVIEYDNTQNGANHIHTVWRVFSGDFGRDLLREHYAADHPSSK
jgi:Protein of unknown function (DUF3500)